MKLRYYIVGLISIVGILARWLWAKAHGRDYNAGLD